MNGWISLVMQQSPLLSLKGLFITAKLFPCQAILIASLTENLSPVDLYILWRTFSVHFLAKNCMFYLTFYSSINISAFASCPTAQAIILTSFETFNLSAYNGKKGYYYFFGSIRENVIAKMKYFEKININNLSCTKTFNELYEEWLDHTLHYCRKL